MKVSKIQIAGYKSIGDECELELNKKTTVLVGSSNVGKSNILESILFAFNDNPIKDNESCSWKDTKPEDDAIRIYFDIEDNDIPLLGKIHTKLKNRKQLVLTKKNNGKREVSFVPDIGYETRFHPTPKLRDNLKNFRMRVRRALQSWKIMAPSYSDSSELVNQFDDLDKWINTEKTLLVRPNGEEQIAVLKEFKSRMVLIRGLLDESPYSHEKSRGVKRGLSGLIRDVENFIPKVSYTEKKYHIYKLDQIIGLLPRIIPIQGDHVPKIIDKIDVDDIESADADNFMKQLLEISEINLPIIKSGHRRRIQTETENANDRLKENLAKYWSQEEIMIEIQYHTDKNISALELDFIGKEGHRGSIFDQSLGFRWFLGFVVKYLLTIADGEDIFLILDEPGLHLHALAQIDLLERFEGTDASIQILYTTHSPYMINKNYPHRIVSVEKEEKGTSINPKPYHSKKGRAWEPIRSAIGLPAGASLFVAGNNLIVEGITDQIIISSIIQAMARIEERIEFDLNKVCICFGGTTSNQIALSLFCHQETDSAKVIFDSDIGEERKAKLIKGDFPKSRIFIWSKIADSKIIDIEDMFSDDFYHSSFIEAYGKIPKIVDSKKLPQDWSAIKKQFDGEEAMTKNWGRSKYYDQYFAAFEDELGGFDKVLVSQLIAEKLLETERKELKKIVRPFKKPLKKIWGTAPNWF